MKNIVLIGMRGSGKSKIGEALAKKLERTFIDLDKTVTQKAKMSIKEIVEKHGWEYFRNLESEAVNTYGTMPNLVIATGGGVVLKQENIQHLKQNGILIFLNAPINILAERISHCQQRPSITGANITEEIEKIWQERKDKYNLAADFIVDVSENSNNPDLDIEKKVEQIIEKVS